METQRINCKCGRELIDVLYEKSDTLNKIRVHCKCGDSSFIAQFLGTVLTYGYINDTCIKDVDEENGVTEIYT